VDGRTLTISFATGELDAIALQLNMRPRKRLNFKCSIEVMDQVMQEEYGYVT